MNLRTQISWAGDGDRIKVVEIAPPGVESDLHREREDPDDNKKSGRCMIRLRGEHVDTILVCRYLGQSSM